MGLKWTAKCIGDSELLDCANAELAMQAANRLDEWSDSPAHPVRPVPQRFETGLKRVSKRQLNLAGRSCLIPICRGQAPEVQRIKDIHRRIEVGVIEQIEKIASQVEPLRFS